VKKMMSSPSSPALTLLSLLDLPCRCGIIRDVAVAAAASVVATAAC
jgi:hypothetical protein